MPTTYTHIATTELSSTQSSVEFTSLGSYTDLIFYGQFATSTAAYIQAWISNSASYPASGHYTQVIDTSTSAYTYSNSQALLIGYGQATSGLASYGVFELHQYRNTNTYRVASGFMGHISGAGNQVSSRLVQTYAIDRIKFQGDSGNLISGTKISVYGILEA